VAAAQGAVSPDAVQRPDALARSRRDNPDGWVEDGSGEDRVADPRWDGACPAAWLRSLAPAEYDSAVSGRPVPSQPRCRSALLRTMASRSRIGARCSA